MRALLLLLVLAACGRPEPPRVQPDASPNAVRSSELVRYACDSGRTVEVWYLGGQEATVLYEGVEVATERTEAASGARYAGGGYTWWSRGSGPGAEGSLYRGEDGAADERLETCRVE